MTLTCCHSLPASLTSLAMRPIAVRSRSGAEARSSGVESWHGGSDR